MLKFSYYARNQAGDVKKGLIEAFSRNEALKKLREEGLYVISLKEQKIVIKPLKVFRPRKILLKDLAVFCYQLSTMLDAGLALLNSLIILKSQTENVGLQRILEEVILKVQEGKSLANAFRRHREIPEVMISMIDVGELGGVLDEVLTRLASYLEKEQAITEKVKSAMIYPGLVLGMALLAIVILLTFIIPTFKQMFEQLGVELPLITRLLLKLSHWTINYWYFLFLAIFLLWATLKKFLKTSQGQLFKDQLIFKLPVFGLLSKKVIISRFASALGTLLKAGVPILTALEVVKTTVNNAIVVEELSQAQVNINNGGGLAGPLAKSKFFTPMVSQLVAIGEETGRLDIMLEKISDYYTREVDTMVNKLSNLLEPLLILVLGSIIASIIFALMLPIFSLINSL